MSPQPPLTSRGAAAHLEALLASVLAVEVDVIILEDFVAALANQLRRGSASLRVASHETHDGLERPTSLLRADVVTALVVLVPEAGPRVLLLVPILDKSDPLAIACVLC